MRRGFFLLGSILMAGLFLWGSAGLAPFGEFNGKYGELVNAVMLAERHVSNAVTAVNFDFRGMDTLGEEFILFAAVTGVIILLAEEHGKKWGKQDPQGGEKAQAETPERIPPDPSDAVRAWSLPVIGLTLLFGLEIVALGHLSMGSGFQGGVILAGAWLLIYLAGGWRILKELTPQKGVDLLEAIGAAGYVFIGIAALGSGAVFLQNFMPLGATGNLFSGGTIPLIDLAVALEVTTGFIILLVEFSRETQKEK